MSKHSIIKRAASTKPYFAKDGGGLKGHVIKASKKTRLGESKLTQPWRVQLLVQATIVSAHIPVIYYVRGQNPNLACTMAHQLWQKWEKFDKGIVTEYPDVTDMGYAECIDEDDFRSAWEDVRKYQLKCRVAGSPEDPMSFTCLGRVDL